MNRVPAATAAVLLITLAGPGCSRQSSPAGSAGGESGGPATASVESGESGLEAITFVCGVDEQTFARALAPATERPVPIATSLAELWSAHGFRLVAVPSDAIAELIGTLRSNGGSQRQWLGQAYSWTEVARGVETQGRVVALDAERIRLPAGTLRMLARSWLEPAPPGAGESGAPTARLHVELVPQNREARRAQDVIDPLVIASPSIDADAQGLLFTRLLASMSLRAGESVVIVPERPGVDWKLAAAEPAVQREGAGAASGAQASAEPPRIGQVVRGGKRNGAATGGAENVVEGAMERGPQGPRVLTLGEAMLLVEAGRNPQRTVLVLTARVPKEFRLLPGGAGR